jgi:hypothetical protein
MLGSGRAACFALSAKGVKLFAARTGLAAATVGGEDGALLSPAEETELVVLLIEAWRGRVAGRLERNP